MRETAVIYTTHCYNKHRFFTARVVRRGQFIVLILNVSIKHSDTVSSYCFIDNITRVHNIVCGWLQQS